MFKVTSVSLYGSTDSGYLTEDEAREIFASLTESLDISVVILFSADGTPVEVATLNKQAA